jgi:hypothetical protein
LSNSFIDDTPCHLHSAKCYKKRWVEIFNLSYVDYVKKNLFDALNKRIGAFFHKTFAHNTIYTSLESFSTDLSTCSLSSVLLIKSFQPMQCSDLFIFWSTPNHEYCSAVLTATCSMSTTINQLIVDRGYHKLNCRLILIEYEQH